MNKENYIRKSHSFTKEALDHLNILNKYMGDIGESAVLRYLIINEIRKVPVNTVGFKDQPLAIREGTLLGYNQELQKQLERLMNKSKEDELAELSRDMLINRLVGKNFGKHEKAETEIEGLDGDAVSRVLGEDEGC